MKKIVSIAVAALFILGLAASAFAIHAEIPAETQAAVAKGTTQVTLNGSIRVRGDYRKSTDYDDDDAAGNKATWDQRVRLGTEAKVADNVMGNIVLEIGNGDTDDVYTWGEPNSGASGVYDVGNAKRGDVKLLEGWILYTPEAVGVKIGHMPLALGNKIFFDHTKFGDDALVLFKDIDNVHIAALTAKFNEGVTSGADDADAYVALVNYKGEGFNLGGDITWVDDQTFVTSTDLYNIGLRGDFNVAGIALKADVEFQSGQIEKASASGADLDFGGYAVVIGAGYKAGDIDISLELGQGSGDDNAADDNFDAYVTSLSPGIPYITYVHGTRSINAAGGGNGITNLTYVKAKVGAPLADALSGDIALVWLQATEEVINPLGNKEEDLGIEIDANLKYKLAKNLVYFVEAGYLMPGDAYNGYDGTDGADNAYAIRHGIELTF